MKQRLSTNQDGIGLVLVVLLLGIIIAAFVYLKPDADITVPTVNNAESSTPSPTTNTSQTDTKNVTLQASEGYSGTGSVSIKQTATETTLTIAAALPNPFETTYYQAELHGGGQTKNLGKLEKRDGQFRLTYRSTASLSDYDSLVITVFVPSGVIINAPKTAMEAAISL